MCLHIEPFLSHCGARNEGGGAQRQGVVCPTIATICEDNPLKLRGRDGKLNTDAERRVLPDQASTPNRIFSQLPLVKD